MRVSQAVTGTLRLRGCYCSLFTNSKLHKCGENMGGFGRSNLRFPISIPTANTTNHRSKSLPTFSSVSTITSNVDSKTGSLHSSSKLEVWEETIEKVIYRCRFFTILGVFGSLVGSILCFLKGCVIVACTFKEYFITRAKVILLLVEAIDVYLLGTVMLVFGMGLYELFVSNLDIAKLLPQTSTPSRSNLFGLFTLKERPKWLEIKSVNELKTKLGHVIVMVLLIGLFEKTKRVEINTSMDLLCFAASVLLHQVVCICCPGSTMPKKAPLDERFTVFCYFSLMFCYHIIFCKRVTLCLTVLTE
ncbi:hypothetical protein Sjap_020046 [Stephania japonica]|uniref:Uncharacterized protein n=1 Tax=Stephania japonica TaxID=461633 RepID=A0AAP0HYP0_9MAGN